MQKISVIFSKFLGFRERFAGTNLYRLIPRYKCTCSSTAWKIEQNTRLPKLYLIEIWFQIVHTCAYAFMESQYIKVNIDLEYKKNPNPNLSRQLHVHIFSFSANLQILKKVQYMKPLYNSSHTITVCRTYKTYKFNVQR